LGERLVDQAPGHEASPDDVVALVEAMRRVALMDVVSDEGLAHYARRGTVLRLPRGAHLAEEGDVESWFQLLLSGRVEWTRRLGGSAVHVLTHSAGDYFGHEPVLLGVPVPVPGTALEPCWVLRFDADAFWELLASCPAIRHELLSTVAQRFGTLESVSQQQARLVAMGTLAAGLAHELNNPAAAIRSAADALKRALDQLVAQAPDEVAETYGRAVERLAQDQTGASGPGARSALDAAEVEDEVGEWLDAAGVDDPWEAAPVLVAAGLTTQDLDGLADGRATDDAEVSAPRLVAHLRATDALAEVRSGAARISDLVSAMRDYTYLDQGPVQDVEVGPSLDATLTVLGHRLRTGGVEVVRDYAPDLPPVPARGSELTQVWTQLIGNALDALDGSGRLALRARRDGDRVAVEVADTGPGIAPDLLERIFDPYFTTRPVGQGVGLGLDVARRIVVGLGGDLRVTSLPGDTVFAVRLPVSRASQPS
jgi:signal transduction histidine kinase